METQEAQKEKRLKTAIITKKNSVATITMNRPEKLNALCPDLVADMTEIINDLVCDETVRALIITGAGKSFSAGGDIKEDLEPLQNLRPDDFNAHLGQASHLYKCLMYMEKPVIAAINGYAVGAGMELALSCDIRIAAEDALIGEYFVKMGIGPEIGSYLLPRLVGLGRAKFISMLGDAIGAKKAEQMGLVDKVVPPDKLMSSAKDLATKLANGPKAVGVIKKSIMGSLTMSFEESIEYTTLLQYQLVHSEDHKEAINAFLEKRKPIFKGK